MNGRELKFCCGGCSGRFMSDKVGNMKKLDEVIVKDQLKVYPIANCIVMPEDELADPRGPKAMEDKNVIIGNRLYRFCCKACIRKFKKDPAKYNAELDKLVIKQQAADYPIDVCVISGRPLGDSPHEMVVANRLVKTCCGGCSNRVKANPTATIAKIDQARQAKSTKTSR
jgi:predicted metal-binding protein